MSGYEFDSRLAYARTLPSAYYFDPDVLENENRNVFARSWQLAGRADQVREPGQFFTTTIANEPLLIVRSSDGELRALSNVCRHRAGPVAKGEGKRPVLQCGYHGWTYGLDGRLLQTPEMAGIECFDRGDFSLPRFQVEIWNELVFVNLDLDTAPLSDFLGDLVNRLAPRNYDGFRLAARKEWSLDCNWKVYVDNYLEGYHIPIVHPGLFRELDYPNYRTETRANYSIQHAPLKRPERIRVENPGEDIDYFWIWPNLMLNVYPDNFSTNLIVPLGPTRTLTLFDWYFRDPDAPGVRERIAETIAFSDEIQLEDIDICEAVQRGLRSATYDNGRYSPSRENGVHHFHGLYAAAMLSS
ncbi:MAG: Rieske 2Fe-2S domain-containing protein [Acidobacteria bacterium]|nr:Rieske 2Fe-2S domain-containing protein [Acidobacteriota bacterium]MBV9070537.1 Rieske 2Fe-2S domain-containing protein [Acidobacteriota bacterium]MBV9188451.1 Rieske 2Fe-2S domain-containing protein [Acidobacteriota bacterium]